MTTPAKGKVNDLARSDDRVEGLERFKNDCALLFDVARFAEWMTERPLQVNAARRLDLLRVLTHNCDPHGRNAGFFNLSLYQSHGLIADASRRGEQDHVDLGLLELINHLLGSLTNQGGDMSSVYMAHEGIVRFG